MYYRARRSLMKRTMRLIVMMSFPSLVSSARTISRTLLLPSKYAASDLLCYSIVCCIVSHCIASNYLYSVVCVSVCSVFVFCGSPCIVKWVSWRSDGTMEKASEVFAVFDITYNCVVCDVSTRFPSLLHFVCALCIREPDSKQSCYATLTASHLYLSLDCIHTQVRALFLWKVRVEKIHQEHALLWV